MVIWPFRKKTYEELTTEELRARLISAAGKSRKELRALCKHYQDQIAANIELMSRVPEGIDQSPEAMNQYVQKLGTVAHCLATDFQSPELWNSLVGSPEDNPLLQWNQWNEALPQRMENLEYEDLISELRSFLEEFKTLEGPAARQNEAVIHGKLGELLFQSGKVADAIQPFQTALTLCQESNDIEGQMAYLNNLLEAHRYLGNTELAIESGEGLLPLYDQFGIDKTALTKRIQLLKTGEPLCRIICVHEDTELETDEIVNAPEGRFEFQFKRNRLPLQKATSLIQQGNVLASEGQLAEALEKYHQAEDVDSYNPDPAYQAGTCLLEMGAYDQAIESFQNVERLAPGWFHCRTDLWLANSLADGTVSDEEFRLLRLLEDGGLPPQDALKMAEQAIETHPEFAPIYLTLGNLQRNRNELDAAIASYQTGLKLTGEPDLETRLLSALLAVLPKEHPDRSELIDRAMGLNGNLVAQATVKLISLT